MEYKEIRKALKGIAKDKNIIREAAELSSKKQKKMSLDAQILKTRKALNVPDDLRICQHICNVMRRYKESMTVITRINGQTTETIVQGIDIYHVEDEEFIKKLSK